MSNLSNFQLLTKTLAGRIIYLVGMMGSGKSLTGPYLSKALKYSFVDQDELIEKVSKMSISQIFEEEGETGFRNLETQVLKEIGTRHSLVVATGGGVVTRAENWGILHQGIVVWIDLSKDRLLKRLELDNTKRPLLKNTELNITIDSLIQERHSFYTESDLQIKVEQETPEEVASVILKKLPGIITN